MMIYYSQQWSDAKKTLKSPGGVQSFLEYRKYWVKAFWLKISQKKRFVHFILLIFELTDQFLQENVLSRHLPNKKLYLWLDGDLPSMKWRIGLILSLSNDVSIIFFSHQKFIVAFVYSISDEKWFKKQQSKLYGVQCLKIFFKNQSSHS